MSECLTAVKSSYIHTGIIIILLSLALRNTAFGHTSSYVMDQSFYIILVCELYPDIYSGCVCRFAYQDWIIIGLVEVEV